MSSGTSGKTYLHFPQLKTKPKGTWWQLQRHGAERNWQGLIVPFLTFWKVIGQTCIRWCFIGQSWSLSHPHGTFSLVTAFQGNWVRFSFMTWWWEKASQKTWIIWFRADSKSIANSSTVIRIFGRWNILQAAAVSRTILEEGDAKMSCHYAGAYCTMVDYRIHHHHGQHHITTRCQQL